MENKSRILELIPEDIPVHITCSVARHSVTDLFSWAATSLGFHSMGKSKNVYGCANLANYSYFDWNRQPQKRSFLVNICKVVIQMHSSYMHCNSMHILVVIDLHL